jgi:hypothetical protein
MYTERGESQHFTNSFPSHNKIQQPWHICMANPSLDFMPRSSRHVFYSSTRIRTWTGAQRCLSSCRRRYSFITCVKEYKYYSRARRDGVRGTKIICTGRRSPVLKWTIGGPQSPYEGFGAESPRFRTRNLLYRLGYPGSCFAFV